ncbi:MAG: hypothetical protein ABIJ36_03805 [Patescibacteria group bacterium]|nr:hypothetical protein [Patescibacteria group bacterium]
MKKIFAIKHIFILLLFLAFSFFLFKIVKDRPESPNDIGFLGGIISWGRYNTPNIDKTIQIITRDKAFYEGKFYSVKPPLLIWVIGRSLHLVFTGVKPVLIDNDIPFHLAGVYLVSTIPILLLTFLMFLLFLKKRVNLYLSLILSFLLFFSSLIFPYAQYLNNHILTALFSVAFFSSFFFWRKKEILKDIVLGVLLSFLLAVEPQFFAIFMLCLSPLLILDFKKNFRRYLYLFLGFFSLTFAHFLLNHLSFGVLYPIQLNMSRFFGYEGSHLYNVTNLLDINVYRASFPILVFNNLLGTHGIFLYMPVLLFFFLYKNKKALGWVFTLALLIVSVIAYSIFSPNFGGWSYGNRRLIPLIPLLYYYAVLAFVETKSKGLKILFVILVVISVFFSYLGFKNTWFNKKVHINRDFSYFPLLYNLNKDYFKVFSYDP